MSEVPDYESSNILGGVEKAQTIVGIGLIAIAGVYQMYEVAEAATRAFYHALSQGLH